MNWLLIAGFVVLAMMAIGIIRIQFSRSTGVNLGFGSPYGM